MSATYIGEALTMLRTQGWIKRSFGSEGGRCMLGAMSEVATGNYDNMQFGADVNAIEDVIRAQTNFIHIVEFNDDSDTVFADVETIMEKAELKRLEEI